MMELDSFTCTKQQFHTHIFFGQANAIRISKQTGRLAYIES